tara:strand:+ start:1203 stop:2096 length:894 start_codon:yes stop_codon:yes gene_type:complete
MYYNLITKPFINKIKKIQDVDEDQLLEALNSSYNNATFSIFPYIYHNIDSKESIKKFKSGNCVALSIYLKQFLKKKFNIKSYLIPASVPNVYKQEHYLDISHVALAVHKDINTIYILDPAFYFVRPMNINLQNQNEKKEIYMKNIYSDTLDLINYELVKNNKKQKLNNYQSFPKDTSYLQCNFSDNLNDTWNYYLREIINPDIAISSFFINLHKTRPFITKTKLIDGNCKCEIMIKFKENGFIDIKHLNNSLYYGEVKLIPQNIIKFLNKNLNGFFEKHIKYYLNLKNIKKKEIRFN